MSFLSDVDDDTGTTADMASRLRSTLPAGWFPVSPPPPAASITPVLDGLLAGLAGAWSFCFGMLRTASAQTRIGTALGTFLDMISVDFFGSHLPRRSEELDDSFRARISASLISRRATRQDVSRAIFQVTSATPTICEPTRGLDCGGYAGASNPGLGGGVGYGGAGLRYGSRSLAFQYLLQVAGYGAFAPGIISTRQSPATFIDGKGLMQSAQAQVLRPNFHQALCSGALLEARAFNLIVNSRFWNDFAQPTGTGGASVNWLVDPLTTGLFGTDPVMRIAGTSGTRVVGPSVDVASAGSVVCGSAWIYVVTGSSLLQVELVLTDLNHTGSSVYAAADMTRSGQWQRLSASLQTQAAPGRNLRVGLLLSGSGSVDATVLTQCWQIESGPICTSYIPTAGTLGIRAQDDVVVGVDPAAVSAPFTVSDILDAVTSTIPAATIAWTAVMPPYAPG